PLGAIEVDLRLKIGVVGKTLRPLPENVAARQHALLHAGLIERSSVEISLDGDAVRGRPRPIGTKAGLPLTGGIARLLAVGEERRPPVVILGVDSEKSLRTKPAAVTGADESALHVAGSAVHDESLRVGRALGNDVDDPVDRVRPPYGGTGTADHLDLLDVLEERILRVPENTRVERRVHAAAVDEHEQLV